MRVQKQNSSLQETPFIFGSTVVATAQRKSV